MAIHLSGATVVDYNELPHWHDDDHAAAVAAFARHQKIPVDEVYKRPPTGCNPDQLIELVSAAARINADKAQNFFEKNFVPVRLDQTKDDASPDPSSIVTGFFEPEYQASRMPSKRYSVPVHARPSQLVEAKSAPVGSVPEGYRFAWRHDDGSMGPAPDRAAIHRGALDGRAEILCWLENPIDAFFMHIQGAARLKLEDGTMMRVSYAAKTGHPFTAIGGLLVKMGVFGQNEVSMQGIVAWLRDHHDEAQTMMNRNRSYIFFKETALGDPTLGPFAAAKIQLTAQRSLAVDMRFHTFATPIYVHAHNVNGSNFSNLMIAQETGTAIMGPSRGDIFFGTGEEAGILAGGVVSPVTFFVLCPKSGYDAYLSSWSGR
ncbi:MAG: MltA domain-containing protein [Pseudomonadota bacterium]